MKKVLLLTALLVVTIQSCTSTKKKIAESQPYPSQINWPEAYTPEEAGFFVHNEIEIKATPETVWNILLAAETWPEWYEGASNVKVASPDNGILDADSTFEWKTMGLDFESTIQEFEPYSRLSWVSIKKSIKGYHAWLIIPTQDGCKLITEESQHGFLTFLEKTFQPRKLEKLHQIWLEKIREKAEAI
ncbi:SRPBCC domain-containing protein [Flagellimonas allohymeniacidonis]|uniref:SRPBCC domain-containing protein n=1 Tax=Flagellimonas allohymeniacidonis TaxID=2517819 RepID=A0A4Q8QI62_9FLAO|nr:SRPBCC domain-containing protein [Allomuricauda hymeniacidonis]TAI47886.1 SRPBCC domain-containing protein [Allomuricauda hymeniacidonis]